MYTLHSLPDSASTAIHCALMEMAVPFDRVIPDWDAGELALPAFRAISPFGKIPALETPDGPMFETGAILLWLSERHGLAPAPGSAERAAFLKWFFLISNSVHPTAMDLIYPERPGGEACAPGVLATAHARQRSYYAALDQLAADRPDWLSPDSVSVLSIYIAMLMRWSAAFAATPEACIPSTDYPHLHAIATAMELRPAIQRAALAEGMTDSFFTAPQG